MVPTDEKLNLQEFVDRCSLLTFCLFAQASMSQDLVPTIVDQTPNPTIEATRSFACCLIQGSRCDDVTFLHPCFCPVVW